MACVLCLGDAASGAHLDMFTGIGHPDIDGLVAYTLNLPRSLLPLSGFVPSNPTGPTFGYTMEDGWISSIPHKQRLCWIPVSCQPVRMAFSGDRFALGTKDGRVVVLDFTGIDSYLHAI